VLGADYIFSMAIVILEHFIWCQQTSIPYDDRIQVLADEHRFEYIVYTYNRVVISFYIDYVIIFVSRISRLYYDVVVLG
jgi:hypothetical protein